MKEREYSMDILVQMLDGTAAQTELSFVYAHSLCGYRLPTSHCTPMQAIKNAQDSSKGPPEEEDNSSVV